MTQTQARFAKEAPRVIVRDATPAGPQAAPTTSAEAQALASELRNAVSELNQRFDTRLAEVSSRPALTIEQVRAELEPHAQTIATMQDALARAQRPNAQTQTQTEAEQRTQRLNAFRRWLSEGNSDQLQELNAWRPDLSTRATQGLAGVNPQGGYVVLDELDREIERISRIYGQTRNFARVVRSAAPVLKKITNKSGTAAYWSSEEGSKTETDSLEFAMNEIVAHEANAIPVYSRVLLADAYFDIVAEINRDMGEAFGKLEAAAFVNGNGVGKPSGFMNIAKAAQTGVTEVTYGKLGFVTTGQAAAWGASQSEINSFRNVQTALKTEYLPTAAYFGNRVSLGQIMLFKDADNRPIWQPSMQAGVPSQLCGYSYNVIEEMDDMGANAFPVTFGSMQDYYWILDVAGMEVLLNPYRVTGFTRFEAWKRVGGKVMKSEAMKAIKVSG